MVEVIVQLRESDVKGAILPLSVVEANEPRDLVRLLECSGFTANTTASKNPLLTGDFVLFYDLSHPLGEAFTNSFI